MAPLPSSEMLAPHFSAGELGADNPLIPATELSNLRYTTAPGLERIRTVLGVPMRITSGYRTPEHNAEIGGSPTSDHPHGLGADFAPIGMSLYAAYEKLRDATDRIGRFDQIIYYPADGHIHVGYGPRMRGQVLIKIGENYLPISDALAEKLTGFVADATKVARAGADAVNNAIGDVTGHRGNVSPTMLVLGVVVSGILLLILFR